MQVLQAMLLILLCYDCVLIIELFQDSVLSLWNFYDPFVLKKQLSSWNKNRFHHLSSVNLQVAERFMLYIIWGKSFFTSQLGLQFSFKHIFFMSLHHRFRWGTLSVQILVSSLIVLSLNLVFLFKIKIFFSIKSESWLLKSLILFNVEC